MILEDVETDGGEGGPLGLLGLLLGLASALHSASAALRLVLGAGVISACIKTNYITMRRTKSF